MKTILFASAECAPFVKTGGLGTVVGSVPKALCEKGYDVRVILPRYECIGQAWKDQMTKKLDFPVRLGWRVQPASLYEMEYAGVIHYFIGNDFYMNGPSPYADLWLDIEKFSFFDMAVLELLSWVEYSPDVIHCHDWHTGLIPVYLRTIYGDNPFYQNIRTVMTIHNLKFQGKTELSHFQDVTGLPQEVFTYDKLEDYGCGNMLKGGLTYADKITTVSASYAKEIMEPEYGEGLDQLLSYRREDVLGIVNGIDTDDYNPSKDPNILYRYDISDFRSGKRKDKAELQRQTGMPVDDAVFTVAIISRLTQQKGLDLLEEILSTFLSMRVQLYILGGGEDRFEQMFSAARERHPANIYTQFQYSDPLAKKMYAGCDAVLMPSAFEPCGLCQLMAFCYATVPIVRLTGGLIDTVRPFGTYTESPTGFGFTDYTSEALLHTLLEAMQVYYEDRDAWDAMAEQCMREDYSWERQSQEYSKLYESAV